MPLNQTDSRTLSNAYRPSPQMPASERSRLRQSTEGTRPQAMRKMTAPLHSVFALEGPPFRNTQLRQPSLVAYAIVIAVLYDTCHFFFGHHGLACFGWPKFRIIIQKSMTRETGGLPYIRAADALSLCPPYRKRPDLFK